MNDLIVNDKLPIGVEFEGKRLKSFSIRPATLRDSTKAVESLGESASSADANMLRYATLAQRVSIEGIPQEMVTLDLLMGLFDRDALALELASDKVEKKLDALSSS